MNFSKPLARYKKATPLVRLGVFGDPIAQSLSPFIQNAALRAAQLDFQYMALEVTSEELPEALEELRRSNFLGINLTMPHKQRALTLVDEVSSHACLLGAINTIVIRDGKLYGHNTDGPGFVAALLEAENFSIKNKRIFILGATGGVGRAIATQCALEGCRTLYLASRIPSALQEQVTLLTQLRPQLSVEAVILDPASLARVMPSVDLIVNATPIGMNPNDVSLIPSDLFQKNHFLYDTIYFSKITPLMEAAFQAGARATNGLSMLLHQGALAFELWFDQPAPLEVMREALRFRTAEDN